MNKGLFKNKNFLSLWGSQITSLLTINLLNFLVIVKVYEQTNSTIASSFIWVAYAIPAIIVGPFAAAAVDMYDRRKILILSNLLQALIVFAYAFLYQRFVFLSYGVISFYSLVNQFYVPAETAFLTRIVPQKHLAAANSLFFVSQQSATIIAFGLAGIANEAFGFQITAIIASMFLFAGFVAVVFLPPDRERSARPEGNIEDRIVEFLIRMKEGFHFIRHTDEIFYPFLFLVWLQIAMSVLVVNLPAIGIEIVKTRPALAGPLVVLPAGIGAVTASIFLTRLLARKIRKQKIVHASLVMLASTFMIVSLLLPIIPFWLGRFVLIASFFGAGMAFVGTLVPTITFLQEKTPEALAGRVFGNFWFVTTALTVLPVIFSATITEILGARLMLFSIGMATIVVYLVSKCYVFRKVLTKLS
jgi:MFS family permease